MKRIVIVGGGFAGVAAVRTACKLGLTRKQEVVLVDDKGVFEYLPSLPYLLSGKKRAEDVSEPLEPFAKRHGVTLVKDEVVEVDLTSNSLRLAKEGSLDYDYLVLAAGGDVEYFGVKGHEYALPAYRLDDYLRIKQALSAIRESGEKVVVVGGGLTGVEVAGEVAEVLGRGRVVLIEKLSELLPLLGNPEASNAVRELLERIGVNVVTGIGVEEIRKDGVVLENGDYVGAGVVIWSAGIRAARIGFKGELPTRGRGWVLVDRTLGVRGYDNVYAPGDINCFEEDGVYAMKMAEEAALQAEVSVVNIARSMEGRKPVEHKAVFTTACPKTLASAGSTGIVVWGKRVAVGKFPLTLKFLLEKAMMSMVRGTPGAGSFLRVESFVLRALDRVLT